MTNDGNNTAQDSNSVGPAQGRWKWPLTFSVVINDLDGNWMKTYYSFKAAHVADQLLQQVVEEQARQKPANQRPDSAPRFIHHIAQQPRQRTLHLVDRTIQTIEEFAATQMNMAVPKHITKAVTEIMDESFKFYPGVVEALTRFDKAGAFTAVYTNTPDYHASLRLATAMEKANVNPAILHATYTRIDDKYAPLSWMDRDISSTRREIGQRMIPYSYKKPDDTPIREIMRITGAKPHEILMIGDSNSDLMSVYKDVKNPLGIFALQELGARDICEDQRHVHKKISPGAEQLGLDAVNEDIKRLGVENDIIRLRGGFTSLLRLMDEGYIQFKAPNVMPMVANHQLVSVSEGMGPHRVARAVGADGFGGGPR